MKIALTTEINVRRTQRSLRPALSLLLLAIAGGMSAVPAAAETYKSEVELSTRLVDTKEAALGSLVADAIRSVAHADAALIPAAAFTDNELTVKPGAFAAADIIRTLEYKDEKIVTVKLTGEQIRSALEHAFYLYPKPNSGFLQISGLIVTVNPAAAGDHHIVSIKIGSDALVPSKTYKVAMLITLANGALAYSRYWKPAAIDKETGKTLAEAITSYLADHKTISKGDGRLVERGK